ncbi:ROK family protein [Oceanispirochaeta crateris]|nr:ROK family protein [Oceanispirochaeta crateris]
MKRMKISNAMNASKQSQVNISLVFNYLRENLSANRSRIAEDLGLSIPAVSRAVDFLEETNRITPLKDSNSSARRGTPVYAINEGFGYIIAIDLFQNFSTAVIVDYSVHIKSRLKGFHSNSSQDIKRDLFKMIDSSIDQYKSESPSSEGGLKAIGIGVPAVVNQTTDKLQMVYYESMKEVQLREVIENRYGVPVFVENICSLSAFAEKKKMKEASPQTLIFVEIGNCIGSGILLDGKVYRGNGFAGEIGYSLIGLEHTGYLGRKKDYLENNASLSALRQNILRELACGVDSSLAGIYKEDKESITPELIFRDAAKGDSLCRNEIAEILNFFIPALHNMIVMLNPEVIILGGDICFLPEIDNLFVKPIKESLSRSLPFPIPEIGISTLGSEAGILGAAALAVDSLLLEEFPYLSTTV